VTELLDFVFDSLESGEKFLKVPELSQAVRLFVGVHENSLGSLSGNQAATISEDPFRRIVVTVADHSSLEESLIAYTSPIQVTREDKKVSSRTTFKMLPRFLIFHLEVCPPHLLFASCNLMSGPF